MGASSCRQERQPEMKSVTALRRMCMHCQVVTRERKKFIYCSANARHKQRQFNKVYHRPQGPK